MSATAWTMTFREACEVWKASPESLRPGARAVVETIAWADEHAPHGCVAIAANGNFVCPCGAERMSLLRAAKEDR